MIFLLDSVIRMAWSMLFDVGDRFREMGRSYFHCFQDIQSQPFGTGSTGSIQFSCSVHVFALLFLCFFLHCFFQRPFWPSGNRVKCSRGWCSFCCCIWVIWVYSHCHVLTFSSCSLSAGDLDRQRCKCCSGMFSLPHRLECWKQNEIKESCSFTTQGQEVERMVRPEPQAFAWLFRVFSGFSWDYPITPK